MNRFGKWKIFSLSPTLSAQPISAFFFFHPAAQQLFFPAGPPPRSWPNPAQRPFPLPVSPPGGSRPSGPSSSPTEPDSSLSPTRPRAPPRPTRARTPRRQPRPYKRNPRPLEAPKPKPQPPPSQKPSRAAAIVEASRSFAAPPFRFVFSTTSLLRSSAVVRGTSPTFYLPPSRSVSAAFTRRSFRSAMRRR